MCRQQQGVSSQPSSSPAASNGRLRADATDPEVMPPRPRRQFTAAPVYTGVNLVEPTGAGSRATGVPGCVVKGGIRLT